MSYNEVTLEQVGPESDATGVFIKKGTCGHRHRHGRMPCESGRDGATSQGTNGSQGTGCDGALPRAFGEHADGPPTPQSWTSSLQDREAKRSCCLSLSVCGTSSQQL